MAKKKQPQRKPIKFTSIGIALTAIIFCLFLLSLLFVTKKISITKKSEKAVTKEELPSYTVAAADNLWKIAQEKYGSGYNFVDIASFNKLTNPDQIDIGQVLIMPNVAKRQPTVGEITSGQSVAITIKEDKYKVIPGDCLWKIALQAYGDGYQWPKIAAENKIPNPDIIYPNQILKIPR